MCLYGFLTRLGIPRILLPAAPGDPGALSAPILNMGGGVAVASLAPNAGDGAENPPKAGAAAGAAWAAGVPPKAKGAFATGVAGAPKLNVDADVGGVGVATDPKPPKAGAGDAADAPKEVDAGGAPKPVAAGDGAPKLGAVAPKLNDVDGAADGVVEPTPNPPNAGAGAAAGAGVALDPKLKGELAGFASVAEDGALVDPNVKAEVVAGFGASGNAGALLVDPNVNVELAAGFSASDGVGAGDPNVNAELAAGFGASAGVGAGDPNVNAELAAFGAATGAPKVKDDLDADADGAGAGFPKLNVGVEGAGVAFGAPKRLGVGSEAGAGAAAAAGAFGSAGVVPAGAGPKENELVVLLTGLSAGVVAVVDETAAKGLPVGNDDVTAGAIAGAAVAGAGAEKLKRFALGGATL